MCLPPSSILQPMSSNTEFLIWSAFKGTVPFCGKSYRVIDRMFPKL